jgi:hypothetical protein
MKSVLRLLGKSPSRIVRDDSAAAPIRETGYEVTDFAGLFAAPKPRFLITIGQSPQFFIEDRIQIKSAGTLSVPTGKLVVFDPCDEAYVDKTILPLATRVPRGDHETYVAVRDDEVIAVAIVFTGDREVEGWIPAPLGDPPPPMPIPPMFAMPTLRFSLGIGDAGRVTKMMERVLVEVDAETWLSDALPPDGKPHPKTVVVPDGTDATLDALRAALAQTRVVNQRAVERKRAKLVASHDGVVAVRCSERPTSWLGLDRSGKPRALVFDFGQLRRQPPDRPPDRFMGLRHRVSPYVSGPGILLDLESVTERFRAAEAALLAPKAASADAHDLTSQIRGMLDEMMEHVHAAGAPKPEADEHARSFLARIKACGKHVSRFEPTWTDDSILDMPLGLARAASDLEWQQTQRAIAARNQAAAKPEPSPRAEPASIDELELSVPASNALCELAIETIDELVQRTQTELAQAIEKVIKKDKRDPLKRSAKDRSHKLVKEISEQLAERGLSLRSS